MIGVAAQYESGPIYAMHQFLLDNGEQLGRLHQYLSVLREEAQTTSLTLEAIVAAHQPQILFIQQYPSVGAWRESGLRLKDNEALAAANQAWNAEIPYQSHSVSLLAGTDYCPPFEGLKDGQRIFEVRIYQAASEWQLNGVHDRFAGPEIPIFHRCGIHPAIYATTIAGPQMPNMTYLTPFASLAEREAAWTRFQADPEWHKVRQASIESHGYAPRVITVSLFKALA